MIIVSFLVKVCQNKHMKAYMNFSNNDEAKQVT